MYCKLNSCFLNIYKQTFVFLFVYCGLILFALYIMETGNRIILTGLNRFTYNPVVIFFFIQYIFRPVVKLTFLEVYIYTNNGLSHETGQ